MSAPLTKRQLEVLQVFSELQIEGGLAPTLKELGIKLNVNRVTVYGHIQALLEKGVLENLMPGASRGLDITEMGSNYLMESINSVGVAIRYEPTFGNRVSSRLEQSTRSLPLLGKIAAGGPILAIESNEKIDIPDLLHLDSSTYLLQVSGDSMVEAQIAHGDWVVVNPTKLPEAKDCVVAILLDGIQEECTLKTYIPLGKGKIKLQPENKDYEATIVSKGELEIRGVVTAVIRTLR